MTAKTKRFLILPGLTVLATFAASCASTGEGPVGLTNGRLAPCPGRPNCVSSEGESGPSRIEPLAFTDAPEAAWLRLQHAIQALGGRIERQDVDYMWATFRSSIFRFVDDAEFRMDAPGYRIQVRSAARVGYWDLGVNRKRIETLRQRFTVATDAGPKTTPR